MRCHRCDQENSGIAKYCTGCGELISEISQVATDNKQESTLEIIADGRSPETDKQAVKKRAAFDLKKYPKSNTYAIQCAECEYTGYMSIVSSRYHPIFWWGLGIFMLINLFLHKWKYLGKVDFGASAVALIYFFRFARHLKIVTYSCPNCRSEFDVGAKYTGIGSITPRLLGWTVFALLLIFFLFAF
jgi:hypothetical protein